MASFLEIASKVKAAKAEASKPVNAYDMSAESAASASGPGVVVCCYMSSAKSYGAKTWISRSWK